MHIIAWIINLKIWNRRFYRSDLNGDVINIKKHVNTPSRS